MLKMRLVSSVTNGDCTGASVKAGAGFLLTFKYKYMNFKTLLALILVLISCFMIGSYATATIKFGKPVETYRWAITGLFGGFFLAMFLSEYRKK